LGGISSAADFRAAYIGTDLRNDHPVGVRFPALNGAGTDFNTPTGSRPTALGAMLFFDEAPANSRIDKAEIRLYDTGDGPEFECASCHDPHGVPSAGPGSKFFPTFLRKSNTNSALCMTCHNK
jgi:Doubled CXXCH motif (Paired_CXXCH_1)